MRSVTLFGFCRRHRQVTQNTCCQVALRAYAHTTSTMIVLQLLHDVLLLARLHGGDQHGLPAQISNGLSMSCVLVPFVCMQMLVLCDCEPEYIPQSQSSAAALCHSSVQHRLNTLLPACVPSLEIIADRTRGIVTGMAIWQPLPSCTLAIISA